MDPLLKNIPSRLPRVFVAYSHSRGQKIFDKMNSLFQKPGEEVCTLVPWTKEFMKGGLRFPTLLALCRESCDFFIVIFTRDDLRYMDADLIDDEKDESKTITELPRDKCVKIPRDNCVLEFALGAGVLGINRVFYFYEKNIGKDRIIFPSDLEGVDGIELDNSSVEALESSLMEKIKPVYESIKEMGFFLNRPGPEIIPRDLFIQFESIKGSGNGQLVKGSSKVTVVSNRPIEADDPDIAKIIVKNINDGIQYKYVYPAKAIYADSVIKSIVNLLISDEWESEKIEDRFGKLKANVSFYLRAKPMSFQYCMHEILSSNKKIYIIWKTAFEKKTIVNYINMIRSDEEMEVIQTDILDLDSNYKSGPSILFAKPNYRQSFFGRIWKPRIDNDRNMYDKFLKGLKTTLQNYYLQQSKYEKIANLILNEIDKKSYYEAPVS